MSGSHTHSHEHHHEHADMERWKHDGVRVIPGNQLDPNVPSTPGIDRKAAINFARAGAHKLWAGSVTIRHVAVCVGRRAADEPHGVPAEDMNWEHDAVEEPVDDATGSSTDHQPGGKELAGVKAVLT